MGGEQDWEGEEVDCNQLKIVCDVHGALLLCIAWYGIVFLRSPTLVYIVSFGASLRPSLCATAISCEKSVVTQGGWPGLSAHRAWLSTETAFVIGLLVPALRSLQKRR